MNEKLRIIPMNLQLFAEETPTEQVTSELEGQEPEPETPKTYTEEEVQAQLQAEADRRVTKALATAKAKWESEKEEELKQTEELAKLSEKERAARELEIERQNLGKDRESFKQERQSFEMERLTLQAERDLISKNLPVDFAPLLVAENAEKTLENINSFETSWQAALQKEIDERIKGATPKGNKNQATVTAEKFQTMDYMEKVQLKRQNPELYNKLKGE